MKRIMLTKYGFERWPEEDFSDDGNRFTCYRAGKRLRVSKHVFNGEVYLSASSYLGDIVIPYKVYSELPHYQTAVWTYNGISITSLTDEDLKNFYNACVAFEQEFENAFANL